MASGTQNAGERPPDGIIMQRMAVERGRSGAIYWIVAGCIFLSMSVTRGAPENVLDWVLLVGGAVFAVGLIVSGIFQLRARARRIAEFEAQHGADAGKQRPVG